ncbi:MAG: chemotaxis protein CheW [Planctomycetota bacterium]
MSGRDPELSRRIKRERAAQLARPVARREAASARGERYLVVRAGAERYGLPAATVARIVAPPPITPLPGAPAFVAGVVALIGEPLTVVHLRLLLGALEGDEPPAPRLLVLDLRGARTALLVCGVEQVREFVEVREHATREGQWLQARHVRGAVERATTLLDIDAVLQDPRVRVDLRPRGNG